MADSDDVEVHRAFGQLLSELTDGHTEVTDNE